MKQKRLILTLTLMLAATPAFALSALQLAINPFDKTFALTGSETGNAADGFGIGIIQWQSPDADNTIPNGGLLYDNDVAFTTTLGTPGGFGRDVELTFTNGGRLFFSLQISTPGETTITGTGAFQSYASLASTAQTALEGMDGTELTLIQGSNFDNLDVVLVPEPSTFAATAGALAASAFLLRRRLRR